MKGTLEVAVVDPISGPKKTFSVRIGFMQNLPQRLPSFRKISNLLGMTHNFVSAKFSL